MKRLLFTLVLGSAGWLLAPAAAQAQTDSTRTTKPSLNTAPPGATPQPTPAPPVTQPAEPAPRPAVPVPAPPPVGEPLPPQPSPDKPSGLDFPPRAGQGPGKDKSQSPTQSKYFLYANFGLGFSSIYGLNQFSVSAAPAIGYRITDRLAVGPGISYAYNSYSYSSNRGGEGIRTNSFGVKAFAQFMVYKQFFLHGEYEVTRAEVLFEDQSGRYVYPGKLTVRTPLAGAGYRQQFSDRAAADIVVLYNFNDGLNDIYGQPVIRFSFLFNLGK